MFQMLSQPVKSLLERLKNQKRVSGTMSKDDAFINVNKLTEKAGAFYEKVRYLVDYKDERHIRRSAIERIAKRKIVFEGGDTIGLSLIQELIAGRYLANNSIAESTVEEVNKIVGKYISLKSAMPEALSADAGFRNTFVSLMSSEIEAFFFPNNEDDFVADAFCATVAPSVKVEAPLQDDEIATQISLACYRSLLNCDDETLRYKLWVKLNPEWLLNLDESRIREIGSRGVGTLNAIQSSLDNSLSFKLIQKLGNYAIYFSIIREIVHGYGAESERVLSDPEMRNRFIKEFLEKNYKRQYGKARGSAVRAVIYIFCTKILLALALELPYQIYIINDIEYIPIATNVLVHPFLLLFMTLSVGKLGDENTEKIISGVEQSVAGENIRVIKLSEARTSFFIILFYILYAMLFFVTFGAIISALMKFHFSIVSTLLFLCFLALVSYFALRIRHSANKWKVTGENDKVFSLLFNLFALPIVRTGKWLSRKFSSINLFVFILDFIIETPFKFMLHLSDAFVSFLKEKQEDVY